MRRIGEICRLVNGLKLVFCKSAVQGRFGKGERVQKRGGGSGGE